MGAGEGREALPTPSQGRAPLVGRPEKLLAGLRAASSWLGMAAALVVPILVLPRLGPWVQVWVGSWGLRVVLGVLLFVGLGALAHQAFAVLVGRLHAGRIYALEPGALVVGEARVWGTPLSRPGEVSGLSHRVELARVKQLFRREMAWGGAPCLGVGLWYLGEDGRGREIWLLLEAEAGERLVAALAAGTGLVPTRGETLGAVLP